MSYIITFSVCRSREYRRTEYCASLPDIKRNYIYTCTVKPYFISDVNKRKALVKSVYYIIEYSIFSAVGAGERYQTRCVDCNCDQVRNNWHVQDIILKYFISLRVDVKYTKKKLFKFISMTIWILVLNFIVYFMFLLFLYWE